MVRVSRPAAFLSTLLGVMITLPGFSVGQHQQQNPPPWYQEIQQAVVPAGIGGLVSSTSFSSILHDCGTIIAIPVLFKNISSSIVHAFTSSSC
jgi:uncharacterized membrane protein AbrB (regulator of aidB expression)